MSKDWFEQSERILEEIRSFEILDTASLELFRQSFLGSKNKIKDLFSKMGEIPVEQKKAFGQKLNLLKQDAEQKFEALKDNFSSNSSKAINIPDLSLPAKNIYQGRRHPLSQVMDRVVSIFTKIGFEVVEDLEIEDDWHNFSALNTPEDHPARDMQDTYYLRDFSERLLRTHTSSVQARFMEKNKPPIRIIAPGRVFRNETISARSHCQFHQVEGLYIEKGVSMADLKQTLMFFAKEMFGLDAKIRLRPSYFPFTEPSAEMDVYWGLKDETDYRITKGTGWLEILGCGMVDPQVLSNCGIDPEVYSGYAFGMGIERQAMLMHKIPDIRYFFENDVRFLKQF